MRRGEKHPSVLYLPPVRPLLVMSIAYRKVRTGARPGRDVRWCPFTKTNYLVRVVSGIGEAYAKGDISRCLDHNDDVTTALDHNISSNNTAEAAAAHRQKDVALSSRDVLVTDCIFLTLL